MLVPALLHMTLVAVGLLLLYCGRISKETCIRMASNPLILWVLALMMRAVPVLHAAALATAYLAVVVSVMYLAVDLIGNHKPFQSKLKDQSVRDLDDATGLVALAPTRELAVVTPPTLQDLYRADRVISVIGKINDRQAGRFIAACVEAMGSSARRVLVLVNTPGGEANPGWAMHEQLRALAAHPRLEVHVLVIGVCYSAGVSLIMGVSREQRWATPASNFVLHAAAHQGFGGRPIPRESLRLDDLSDLDRVNGRWIIDPIAAGTAIPASLLAELIASGRDHHIDTGLAVRLGLIGGIVT